VKRYNGSQVLVSLSHNADSLATLSAPPKHRDYDAATLTPKVSTEKAGDATILSISGEIELLSSIEGGHDIDQAELHVKYLPDRTDLEGFAELTVRELN